MLFTTYTCSCEPIDGAGSASCTISFCSYLAHLSKKGIFCSHLKLSPHLGQIKRILSRFLPLSGALSESRVRPSLKKYWLFRQRRPPTASQPDRLGFHTVGYGCMTCVGNSGEIDGAVSQAIADEALIASAVLSGNRNFEARIRPGRRQPTGHRAVLKGRGIFIIFLRAGCPPFGPKGSPRAELGLEWCH